MLKQEIKLSIFILCLVYTSCTSTTKNETRNIQEYSQKTIGLATYNEIFKLANDSLHVWAENKLENYRRVWALNGRLDSTLCFNKRQDKMIGAILVQCNQSTCSSDDIHYFYGAKVKGRWYFFLGGNLRIFRSETNSKVVLPFSFEELHKIAGEQLFKNYLIKRNKGNWEINDDFFKGMENKHQSGGGYGNCFECRTFEEYVLHLSKENWRKKAKEEF